MEATTLHDACKDCWTDAKHINVIYGAKYRRALAKYRGAQRILFNEMRWRVSAEDRWLISDFVTLGSPLTYATFLLARNKDHFDEQRDEG